MTDPHWWARGLQPATTPRGEDVADRLTGSHTEIPLPPVEDDIGLRRLYVFDARVTGVQLALTDIHLTVEWSQFDDCHFTQRVRPVLNAQGIAAQGSFAITPSIYRRCTFERVRFNMLSGFSLGRAVFEGCTFVNCRREGHFAHDAWLVDNRFLGRMNGCAWYGHGQDGTKPHRRQRLRCNRVHAQYGLPLRVPDRRPSVALRVPPTRRRLSPAENICPPGCVGTAGLDHLSHRLDTLHRPNDDCAASLIHSWRCPVSLSVVVLLVLLVGVSAFVVTLTLATRRVVASGLEMRQAMDRMNAITVTAAVLGLGIGMWAWVALPTAFVSATSVPGLLAALGPSLAGLVYLGVTGVGEATWRRPTGPQRAAHLAPRPLFSRAQPWAARALWAWAALLGLAVVVFGVIAAPDGRSIGNASLDGCVVDGVPVPCHFGASGPFPGWPYGLPILIGAATVLVVTLGVLYLVARRPAVRGTSTTDDELLRTVSATRVVRGAQLALGITLAGVTFFAGATASNAGWWWGWALLLLAVAVLGTSVGIALRRVAP